MRVHVRLFWSVVLACALLAAASSAAGSSGTAGSGQARWVMTDLGTLGGQFSRAWAINNQGQVMGTSLTANGEVDVFLWQNGSMKDVGPAPTKLDRPLLNERGQVVEQATTGGLAVWEDGVMRPLGPLWFAAAINDRGQIVGSMDNGKGDSQAALWYDGRLRDLGVLPGYYGSWAIAINAQGVVVGFSEGPLKRQKGTPSERAFIWENGKMRDLGAPPGFASCEALAINNHRQVLGHCDGDAGRHTVLWEPNRIRDLGAFDLFTSFLGALGALAGVNDRGQVVGMIAPHGGGLHLALWEDGKLHDLGTLGGRVAECADINDQGQIVGKSTTPNEQLMHAFVWANGVMTDLARPGPWNASDAVAINDHGQIAGTSQIGKARGSLSEPPHHAVLWTLKTSS